MEQIENRMLIDSEWERLENHTDWDEYYDAPEWEREED